MDEFAESCLAPYSLDGIPSFSTLFLGIDDRMMRPNDRSRLSSELNAWWRCAAVGKVCWEGPDLRAIEAWAGCGLGGRMGEGVEATVVDAE